MFFGDHKLMHIKHSDKKMELGSDRDHEFIDYWYSLAYRIIISRLVYNISLQGYFEFDIGLILFILHVNK